MKTFRLSRSMLFAGLLSLSLSFASHAWACKYDFSYTSSSEVRDIISDPDLSSPSVSTADCQRLNRFTPFLKTHHIDFSITADHFVNSGVSVAWATARLQDQYGITSSFSGVVTRVRADPDDAVARQLTKYAATESIFNLDLPGALANLRKTEIKDGLEPIPALP
ncbi:hypothetical protein GALL_500810 [mine drainage metagenome]|uniref:Uncharacterized protein n=1 Tax=mine drainage metagenome TaxID=410659 RepID=A0A1J5PKK5_9ZZZZ